MTILRTALRRGLVAAVATALIAAGAGAAYAGWSATATVTSTAGAAQLALTTANFSTNAYTFGNETLTTTGSVTVTNTTTAGSTRMPALTLTLAPASSAPLASAVTATIWHQPSGGCTASTAVGAGAVSGTWTSGPVLTTTLAKGATATFCIRSTIADRQAAAASGGALSFTPRVSAVLSVGNFTATQTATATQSTRHIHPLAAIPSTNWYAIQASGQCMDVSGGGTSNHGTAVISYPCHQGTNQQWQLVQDGASGWYDITPRSGTGTSVRADVNGATANGSPVTVRTDTTTPGQLWQPQLVAAGTYQFVNKLTGYCLTATTVSSGAMTQAVCDGSTAQRHTLSVIATTGPAQLQNLTCTSSGSIFGGYRATYSWTSTAGGPFTIEARRTSGSAWAAVSAATGTTASSAFVDGSLPSSWGSTPLSNWGYGEYPVRIVNGNGEVVGTSTVTVADILAGYGVRVQC